MRSKFEAKALGAAIGASPTYNPLGDLVTFLSVKDIVAAVDKLIDT